MRPSCQLSSMKRMTDVWSVLVWSTWLTRLHGEMTRNGSRGPYPHRPWYPASGGAEPPQRPGPLSASAPVREVLTSGGRTWS